MLLIFLFSRCITGRNEIRVASGCRRPTGLIYIHTRHGIWIAETASCAMFRRVRLRIDFGLGGCCAFPLFIAKGELSSIAFEDIAVSERLEQILVHKAQRAKRGRSLFVIPDGRTLSLVENLSRP